MQNNIHSPDSLQMLKIKFNEQQSLVQEDIDKYRFKQLHDDYNELERLHKLILEYEEKLKGDAK